MFQTGLVSVSFRQHTPEQIVPAAAACGLQSVEWGSDIHVPCSGADAESHAAEVRRMTEAAGLTVAAYGSYYRLGESTSPAESFAPYLKTAAVLGAPVIRIWGGGCGSAGLDDAAYEKLAGEARTLAGLAAPYGIRLALECHNGTLTDDYHSSLRFLRQVDRPNLTMYWQPNQNRSPEYDLESAAALAPFTTNIHVFSWQMENGELRRLPLAAHEQRWRRILEIFAAQGGSHALLLEFMHDDRLETLAETAHTLQRWLEQGGF